MNICFKWCDNYRIKLLDAPLKVAILLALPVLFGIWLGLSIAVSVLVGIGYGFFTPWVSTFEAFRHENESKKFLHSVVVQNEKKKTHFIIIFFFGVENLVSRF